MVSRIWASVAVHGRELLRLATPTIVMRSGALVMLMVDIIMLGRASSRELAYYSLAQGPVSTLMLTTLGLLMGTLVVTAQYLGAGRDAWCGGVWRRSVPYGFVVGSVAAGACATGPTIFLWLDQDPALAVGAAEVMGILGLGLPLYLGYLASAYFLEGLKRPWPGTRIMVAGNVLNVVLNAWWIHGGWGVEPMGATGAAWATTVSRGMMCLVAALYVWTMRDHDRFGIRASAHHDRDGWALQRRLGYAAGASIGVEAFAFASLNIMAGWFGAESLAAYAIGINVLGMMFMIALGIGSATSVRVGHAIGRGDRRDAEIAGWTGLGLNTLLSVPLVLSFLFWPRGVAGIYSDDPTVLPLAGVLVAWIAMILPFDGAQAVMSNALRGRGETWMPMVLQSCAYLLVMMPCAWLFSVGLSAETSGLFQAIAVASLVSSCLLSWRFWMLARRDERRCL